MEDRLILALRLVGKSFRKKTYTQRFLSLWYSMTSLLSNPKGSNEDVVLGEALILIVSRNAAHKKKLMTRFSELILLKNTLLSSATRSILENEVVELQNYILNMILSIIEKIDVIKTLEDLWELVEEKK